MLNYKHMIIFLILFLFTSTAKAEVYEWKVLRTVDGDSLAIANQFLPEELKLFVRAKGVDTPEKAPHAKCEKENALGQKATIFTKKAIENAQKNNQKITFTEIKWDKYGGRIVAKVFINNIDLAQELIKNGLGRVYFGDKKKSWCD
jgi:endonuclease YncB( thermonuclease family)